MESLESPIRAYAWGSRTAIARLQGRPEPTPGPEAELWMGAHPDSPSTLSADPVHEGRTLERAISADPAGWLGAEVADRFGGRLPFMLKYLAAASPLSLQAHPDAGTASSRYRQERAIPSGDRLYTDPYAKPELLVALTDFDTLCGYRDPAISADALTSLRIRALEPVVGALRTGPVPHRLRVATEMLLRWPAATRETIVASVGSAARARGIDYLAALADAFPGDMGVVVTLLLNHVRLSPDEAIFMPAGNMHAYLEGTGMEILGASDNVLRGGLTAKRVDVPELLRVLRYEVLADPVVKPVVTGPGVLAWPVPVEEFSLLRVTVAGAPVTLEPAGPRIVFCAAGEVTVGDTERDRDTGAAGEPVTLTPGRAGFGAAGRTVTVSGTGVAFVASTGS
jgi:mannose-6-phosphate isomerase